MGLNRRKKRRLKFKRSHSGDHPSLPFEKEDTPQGIVMYFGAEGYRKFNETLEEIVSKHHVPKIKQNKRKNF